MSNLALDNIRKKVAYQNTVDIWIAMCQEQDTDWNSTENIQKIHCLFTKNKPDHEKISIMH